MALDQYIIDQIRERVDIVSLISSYIPVTKKGRNYVATCPFHDDTNPSMSISQDKQIYKCFVCGNSGNVFTFVMEYEHVSFLEAVKIVGEFVGINVDIGTTKEYKVKSEEEERLLSLMEDACAYYEYMLTSKVGEIGLNYLTGRNMSKEVINKFRMGYSPSDDSSITFLTKKGYSIDELINSGIAYDANGKLIDRFKGRVLFPITNLEGRVVAFSGRKIDASDAAKYVNSPETKIFIKGDCLYNYASAIDSIRKNKKVYVLEGNMDVIAMDKAGYPNSVAFMGTAFTPHQIDVIKSLRCEVVCCLDNDNAGQSATYKLVEELSSRKIRARVIKVSNDSKDVDELFNTGGKAAVDNYLSSTLSSLEFKIMYSYRQINPDNHNEKKEFVKKILIGLTNKSNDELDKEYYINMLSSLTNFNKNTLRNMITNNTVVNVEFKRPASSKSVDNRYLLAQREIISEMLSDPIAIDYISRDLNIFEEDIYRKVAKSIINHYNDNGKLLIGALMDDDISNEVKDVISTIAFSDLTKKFDQKYYDIMKCELPLVKEIELLKYQMSNTFDPKEKVSLAVKKSAKEKELAAVRKKCTSKGGY